MLIRELLKKQEQATPQWVCASYTNANKKPSDTQARRWEDYLRDSEKRVQAGAFASRCSLAYFRPKNRMKA